MTHARRWFMLLAACLGALALAGCAVGAAQPAVGGKASAIASRPAAPSSAAPSAKHVPPDVNVAAFNALARREASAWPSSPLGKVWKTGLVVPVAEKAKPRKISIDTGSTTSEHSAIEA